MPSVIFIEPEYADAPMSDPNDDHPPARIAKGQDFVRSIYEIVTSNPGRWEKTLMIVTYDEHGGFFDHVPPPSLPATINGHQLATTGPRVPALLVSPHVGAGQVFSESLDHTSVLQLIADRFGKGGGYSDAVTKRQEAFGRIANALLPEARAGKAPAMPARKPRAGKAAAPLSPVPTAPDTPNAAAIDAVMRDLARDHPELINQPAWAQMRVYLETNEPPQPEHKEHIGDVDDLSAPKPLVPVGPWAQPVGWTSRSSPISTPGDAFTVRTSGSSGSASETMARACSTASPTLWAAAMAP